MNDPSRGNPSAAHPDYHDLDSRIALAGHPIHAMLVAFPIAGVFAVGFCDMAYWWTGDTFWSRAGVWGSGGAFVMGGFAALSGMAEVLLVPGVRRRAAAWSHAVVAMVLLSVIAINWAQRIPDPAAGVLPFGILLSGLSLLLVAITGWHGGKLVFEHQVGVNVPSDDEDEAPETNGSPS